MAELVGHEDLEPLRERLIGMRDRARVRELEHLDPIKAVEAKGRANGLDEAIGLFDELLDVEEPAPDEEAPVDA